MSDRRVAVVTGASSGIGAALARSLGRAGWLCVLLARRRDRLEGVAAEVGGEAEVCDVSDRAEVERVAAEVLERHPALGLLVNNAGVRARTSFFGGDVDRIEQVVRTNYFGSVWCLRAFLPGLERGRPSRVVNIVSVAGTVAFPPSGPYCASKHAQAAFSRAAAAELLGRGVRVHTVYPGFVDTEGFPNRERFPERLRRFVIEPEDVAAHVMRVLDDGRLETFVPWWYRPAAMLQAVAPGLLVRTLARRYRS